MARARNIKPSIYKNELLGVEDPLLTILFTGLWCLADRDGRLEDRPLRIKAEIFPYREIQNFNGYLTELERMGFIDRYSVDGVAIIQVINFAKHQSPHKTEKHSELPEKPVKPASCPITVKAPLETETPTVKESLIPDSLLLIPDSGSPIPESPARDPRELFAEFWEAFPNDLGNKGNKQNAETAFLKLKPDKTLFAEIMRHLDLHVRRKRELKAAGQFVGSFKHVERWLAKKGWTDELDQFEIRPAGGGSASDTAFAEYLASKDNCGGDYIDAEYAEVDETPQPH